MIREIFYLAAFCVAAQPAGEWPMGGIRKGGDVFLINNLIKKGKVLVLLSDKQRIDQIYNNKTRNVIIPIGIGGSRVGVYLDVWTWKEKKKGIEELTGEPTKEDLKRIKTSGPKYSGFVPIYIIPNEEMDNTEKYPVEKKTTVILSTMWENVFRITYAVYSGIYSLIKNKKETEDLIFMDVSNEELSKINKARRSTPMTSWNILKVEIMSLFGEYRKYEEEEKRIYKTVSIGVSNNSLFEEFNEVFNYNETENFSMIKEAWGVVSRKVMLRNKSTIPEFVKEVLAEANGKKFFLVVLLTRKKRVIINEEEIINEIKGKYENEIKTRSKILIVKKVDFEDIKFIDQLEIMERSDVFIASHGAGMIHFLFMRPNTSVIEIFPYKFKKTIYKNISRYTQIRYFHWQNNNLSNSRGSLSITGISANPKIGNYDPNAEYKPIPPLNKSNLSSKDIYRGQDTYVCISEFMVLFNQIIFPNTNEKYLVYLPWEQFNNQVIAFKNACILAKKLDRVLVLPKAGYRNPETQKRINEFSLAQKNTSNAQYFTDDTTFFKPLEYVWNDFEKYFDSRALSNLSCKTIPHSVFSDMDIPIEMILFEKQSNSGARYNSNQLLEYYQSEFKVPDDLVFVVSNKPKINLSDEKAASIYNSTASKFKKGGKDCGEKVLSLGMLFNKLKHGENAVYPLTKYYDYMIDKEYADVTKRLKYNPRIYSISNLLIKRISSLGVIDLALHIRRKDYIIKCKQYMIEKKWALYKSCYQDNKYIDSRTGEIITANSGKVIYISSDTLTHDEISEIPSFIGNKVYFFNDLLRENEIHDLDEIEISIIEQIICSKANVFIGNYFSSYSRSIVEIRNGVPPLFW